MIWDDEGYLLSKVNYNENSIIADFFTLNHGKCSGIIFGGSSRKAKKYLQVGNKIFISCNSNLNNKLGYFKTELIKPVSPLFFNDKKRISCILSATTILKVILAESQVNQKIYNSLEDLINSLSINKWIIFYIYWEQLLLKELGYDADLLQKNKISIEINNTSFLVPSLFNVEKKSFNNDEINEALQFNKKIIVENFFDGKEYLIPRSRFNLEKYYL